MGKRKHMDERIDYKKLDSSSDEIRLIRLSPASTNEPVQCSLFNTSRDSAPPYKALSYVWGDLIASDKIIINSSHVLVTENLKNALIRLRPRVGEQELILWVDAICINQDDIPERGIQISAMRTTYRNASSVLVYLGLEEGSSAAAIKLARDLSQSNEAQVSALLREESIVGMLGKISALVVLFRRQYFWRIWVIQEIYYAKSAMVYCGDDEISWSALDKVCDIWAQHQTLLQSKFLKRPGSVFTLSHGGPRGLQLSRYSRANSDFPPLLELLLSHKSKKSTDPKDKVYALIGISSSKTNFGSIDYSLTVREIFTHTARHIISTSKKLDVICVKSHNFNNHNLPSWAPDWTRPPDEHGRRITFLGLQHCEIKFVAAGTTVARYEFMENGYVLKATGVVLAEISNVSDPFRKSSRPNQTFLALEAVQNWWTLFSASRGTSASARLAFCHVASCGNWSLSTADECERKLSAMFALFDMYVRAESDAINRNRYQTAIRSARLGNETMSSASLFMNGRRLFFSDTNLVGLAPWDSREGDIVCVLLGCRFPVVLREEDEKYILIGEAYVENFMAGEAVSGVEEKKLETFEIR